MRILGILIGIGAVYSLLFGSWIAIAKPIMDSSDVLLVAVTLMAASQLVLKLAESFDKTSGKS